MTLFQKQNLLKMDPFFNSIWLMKFINKFTKHGRKSVAEKIVMGSFQLLKDKIHKKPILLLLSLIIKTRPLISFVSMRKGKRFIDIPVPLPPKYQLLMALKWIVLAIKINKATSLQQKINKELLAILLNKNVKLKARKKAFLKRTFDARLNARYRWK